MTRVKLHGRLGEFVGKNEWDLNVSSVREAMHAINTQSNDSIRKYFLRRENLYSTYDVLVNNEKVKSSADSQLNELALRRGDI